MRLLKENTNLDFMAKRVIAAIISTAILVVGIVGYIAMGGLKYGIDFQGGTIVQVQFTASHPLSELRETLSAGNIGSFTLQAFGDESANEYLISAAKAESANVSEGEGAAQAIERVLSAKYPDVAMRRVESVGPKVGEELKAKAGEAILFSILAILVYIWVRFQWRYGVGAVVALLHDVLIVLAAFLFTGKEITLPVVAAVLTVAGYSINDTIVIFDRIRENFLRFKKKKGLDVLNQSINQTLNRTLLTSGTTLFVLFSIFLFGGEIINDFAFALLVGVLVGTYSSIFIASPVLHFLNTKFPAKTN